MTRRQLLLSLDSQELAGWIAFDRVEPLPDSYWQAALIACTVARSMSTGKGRTPKLEDFLPQTRANSRTQTPEEAHALFAGFAAAHNAALKRLGKID